MYVFTGREGVGWAASRLVFVAVGCCRGSCEMAIFSEEDGAVVCEMTWVHGARCIYNVELDPSPPRRVISASVNPSSAAIATIACTAPA